MARASVKSGAADAATKVKKPRASKDAPMVAPSVSAFTAPLIKRDGAAVRASVLQRLASIREPEHTVVKDDAIEEICPTGSIVIDHVLGLQGVPLGGRYTQYHGDEHTGKSTLCYFGAANFQRLCDEPVAVFDFERTVMPAYLQSCGMDIRPGHLILRRPDSAESALPVIMELLEAGCRYFIFDSVAKIRSMVDPKLLKKGKGLSNQPGQHAKTFAEFVDAIGPHMARYNAAQVFVNQTRARIEMTMDAARAMKYPSVTNLPYILAGGKAARFQPSVMLETVKAKAFEGSKEGDKEGLEWLFEGVNDKKLAQSWGVYKTNLRVLKNKVNAGGYRKHHIYLRPGTGIDDWISVRELARHYNLIRPTSKGQWIAGLVDSPLKTYASKKEAIEDLVLYGNLEVLEPLRALVVNAIHADEATYRYERSQRDGFISGDIEDDPIAINGGIDMESDAEFNEGMSEDDDDITLIEDEEGD